VGFFMGTIRFMRKSGASWKFSCEARAVLQNGFCLAEKISLWRISGSWAYRI
jgi:hypothetical protein